MSKKTIQLFCSITLLSTMFFFSFLSFVSLALVSDKTSAPTTNAPVAPNSLSEVALLQFKNVMESAQNTYTQTQAWFSNKENVKKLDESYCEPKCPKTNKSCACKPYWKERYEKLLRQCIVQEHAHAGMYCFYHAFNKVWLVPQDLYKFLYEKKYGPLKNPHFVFLRFEPLKKQTAKEFLNEYLKTKGIVDDTEEQNKIPLLSVNVFPTGNAGTPGEATLSYVDQAMSHEVPGAWAYAAIAKQFDIPLDRLKNFETRLNDLAKMLGSSSPREVLLQICIPKNIVDEISYISWRHGIPRHDQIVSTINQMADVIKKNNVKKENYLKPFERIKKASAMLSEAMVKEQENNSFYRTIKQAIENDGFKTSTWIDQYTKAPALLMGKDNEIQARLLTNGLQDPNSGIIMYKYYFISPAVYQTYRTKLQAIAEELWKMRAVKTTANGTKQ
ncbi:MAG: hypothetical protein UU47_C0003G0042 [candidate division TM6 bacterium GW2011_GWE2_41_16]|nr:MAG: hypothetical protein UU47_C0003G0042 [candidate division TM6 bacterium GW2011_GWE2_41_16]